MRIGFTLTMASLVLAGCASRPAPTPASSSSLPPPTTYTAHGLGSVLNAPIASVVGQFGTPDLDVSEGPARKLQFLGPACVLDVYFYPRGNRGEHVAIHVDARLPDGREMDRASCVAAFAARQRAQ